MRHVLLASALILSFSASALGNAFDESRPYRFPTSGDRFNNAFTLDIIEKKKGGFYDGFDTTNNNTNTFITNQNGDVINCTVQASSTGNQHIPGMTATTGSNVLSPAMNHDTSAQGNGADNNATDTSAQSTVATGSSSNNTGGSLSGGNGASGSDFSVGSDDENVVGGGNNSHSVQDQLNNTQNNSGNQTSQSNNNTNTFAPGNVSSDNNTSNQTLNNTQNNNGSTQTATVNDSTGLISND
jgi:hypothetical protein